MRAITLFNKVKEIICLLSIVGGWIFFLAVFWTLPDKIPTHFNFAGEPDGWGGKLDLLIIPAVNTGLYLLLSVIQRHPSIWNTGVRVTEENKHRVYAVSLSLLITVKLIISLGFTYTMVAQTTSSALAPWYAPVFLGVTVGTVIYYFIRLFRAK